MQINAEKRCKTKQSAKISDISGRNFLCTAVELMREKLQEKKKLTIKPMITNDNNLENRVREYLSTVQGITIEEKKMFGGLAFLVNDKMCMNVKGDILMCRFNPELTEQLSERTGFLPTIMKGREYKGYCYVEPGGYKTQKELEFWLNLCLDYNEKAVASAKKKRKK